MARIQANMVDADGNPAVSRTVLRAGLDDAEDKFVLVDVRGAEEIGETGIFHESAVNIPLPELHEALGMSEDDFEEKYDCVKFEKNECVVFACRAGVRSGMAVRLARDLGYEQPLNYIGGANEWFGQKE